MATLTVTYPFLMHVIASIVVHVEDEKGETTRLGSIETAQEVLGAKKLALDHAALEFESKMVA